MAKKKEEDVPAPNSDNNKSTPMPMNEITMGCCLGSEYANRILLGIPIPEGLLVP